MRLDESKGATRLDAGEFGEIKGGYNRPTTFHVRLVVHVRRVSILVLFLAGQVAQAVTLL